MSHKRPSAVPRVVACNSFENTLVPRSGQKLSASRTLHVSKRHTAVMKQIFDLAVSEQCAQRNPALQLFTPREAPKPTRLVMNLEEVRRVLSVLEQRERLIVKLALLAGMRPGEILALTWERLTGHCAEIRQRLYRGKVDVPKTTNSIRKVALSEGLLAEIES